MWPSRSDLTDSSECSYGIVEDAVWKSEYSNWYALDQIISGDHSISNRSRRSRDTIELFRALEFTVKTTKRLVYKNM